MGILEKSTQTVGHSTTKPLLLGLRPRKQDSPDNVPLVGTASGGRIEKLSGVAPGELLSVYDVVNLYQDFQDSAIDQDRLEILVRDRVVVCLGVEAAAAMGQAKKGVVLFQFRPGSYGATCVTIPHPSGLSRAWNDCKTTYWAEKALAIARELCTNAVSSVLFSP